MSFGVLGRLDEGVWKRQRIGRRQALGALHEDAHGQRDALTCVYVYIYIYIYIYIYAYIYISYIYIYIYIYSPMDCWACAKNAVVLTPAWGLM